MEPGLGGSGGRQLDRDQGEQGGALLCRRGGRADRAAGWQVAAETAAYREFARSCRIGSIPGEVLACALPSRGRTFSKRPQYPSQASSGPLGRGTRNHFSNMRNRATGTATPTPKAL